MSPPAGLHPEARSRRFAWRILCARCMASSNRYRISPRVVTRRRSMPSAGARRACARPRHPRRRRPQPLGVHLRRAAGRSGRGPGRGDGGCDERIDLRTHEGVHPRVGAADVVPFVRFPPTTPRRSGRPARWASGSATMGIPCFGYGELGDGRRPALFRAGGVSASPSGSVPARSTPPSGRRRCTRPRARCCSACARRWLRSTSSSTPGDVEPAAAVAAAVRAQRRRPAGGAGDRAAAGVDRPRAGLDEPDRHRRDAAVAGGRGGRAAGRASAEWRWSASELVGLMPASVAAWAGAARGLRLPDSAADRMLEVAVAGQFGGGRRSRRT